MGKKRFRIWGFDGCVNLDLMGVWIWGFERDLGEEEEKGGEEEKEEKEWGEEDKNSLSSQINLVKF